MMRRQDVWPLGAIGLVLTVNAAWWGLALWSVPGAPAWLERARAVCFNITESGLPDTKGWLMLLGQPPIMVSFLLVGWGRAVGDSLRRLLGTRLGRAAAGATLALFLTGLGLTAAKVVDARLPDVAWGADGQAPLAHPRVDRPWPEAGGLIEQAGLAFSLERLGGRPALVTFAFGHCETLCPVVVHQALAARAELDRRGVEASLVVFTLDPWRDTPRRLGTLLRQWGLDPTRDLVVGGSVEAVQSGLDAWSVARTRDERTGDILHAGIIHLVEPDGTIAFSSAGGVEHVVSLGERLLAATTP
jgi:protein SCO1/2